MPQNNKKKICIIVDCLCHGGAEKMAGFLSIELVELGYEVSLISLRNDIRYAYNGHLFNLGTNEPKSKIAKQFRKLLNFRKAVKAANADYYIDFRMRNRRLMESTLHRFVFPAQKMIFTMHNYKIGLHKPEGNQFDGYYHRAHKIVAVSKAIDEKLQRDYLFKNTELIYNFIEQKQVLNKSNEQPRLTIGRPYILTIARLNNKVKQLDKLINCYKESQLPFKGIKLVILGDGRDRSSLETLIKNEQLQDHVKLMGFVENPYPYIKNAKALVLSSKFEGFPMVFLEALELGTPVISFDCPSGPNEIIVDGHNGLLVEDQNFQKLQEAMEVMVSDSDLYNNCQKNAKASVAKFKKENSMKRWQELLD